MAVTVALIIWGVAPAKPPAIIVRYSSMFAVAEKRRVSEGSIRDDVSIPSPAPSSSMPSMF